MKKSISLLLAALMVLFAFTALIPTAVAADTEYFFDFEKCTPDAPYASGGGLVPSGYFHWIESIDPPYGKVLYIANGTASSSVPISPTTLTFNTGYIDKVIEFDFTYSGVFGTIGGLYVSIYQNAGASVYTIISPVCNHQWKDSSNSDTALATTSETFGVGLWFKAKLAMNGNGVYSKVWNYDSPEPAEWNCYVSTDLQLVAQNSQVSISMDGTTDKGGSGSRLDNVHIAPLTDDIRATLPKLPQKCTLTLNVDSKAGSVRGGTTVFEGTEVQVIAAPKGGYDFVNWTDESGDVISTDPIFNYVLMEDMTLTANFVKKNSDKPVHTHTFGEWEVVTPATKDAVGQEKRVCTECGETETREIPVLTEEEKSGCASVIVSGMGLIAVATLAGAACLCKRKEK